MNKIAFTLNTRKSNKQFAGATYRQIECLKCFSNVEINTTVSQILERISYSDMEDALYLASKGIKVVIE